MTYEEQEDPFEGNSSIHSKKLHVWGAISSKGTVSLSLFEDNMDGDLYRKIIRGKTNEMSRMFPEGFIFMQDNDPKHKAKKTMEYLDDNFMETLLWPSYSPDVNPIENIWSWLKGKVSKEMPQNLDDLKKKIKKYWNQITPAMLEP